jgi:hypothetical protein
MRIRSGESVMVDEAKIAITVGLNGLTDHRAAQRRMPAHSRSQLPEAIFSRSASLKSASSRKRR